MDYQVVYAGVDALVDRGWSKKVLAMADGYPVFLLEHRATDPNPTRPSLLIDAGIHGEEPGSVIGLFHWLQHHADRWLGAIDFTVFPCLNPWGFERGIRYDPRNRDLNREFNNPLHPAVVGFCKAIEGRRFELFMDLHEDCDFYGTYLYEVVEAGRTDRVPGAAELTLGRRILDACQSIAPLSHGEEVGELITDAGMLAAPLAREELDAWDEWPIALYAYVHHTDHVVTVETPGKQPLETRSDVHARALDVACGHLIDRATT